MNTEDWGQFSYGLGFGGLTEVAIVHLQETLFWEIVRVHNDGIRKTIIEAVRSMAAEKIVEAVLPSPIEMRQQIDQEVRRHARKLIGKMLTEPENGI